MLYSFDFAVLVVFCGGMGSLYESLVSLPQSELPRPIRGIVPGFPN